MEQRRKIWNENQKELRKFLDDPGQSETAVQLFLLQHAMVHTRVISLCDTPTFEDEVWLGLDDPAARLLLQGFDHSIAWIFWHLTRIEDMTLNVLVAGQDELLFSEGWYNRLGIEQKDSGNETSREVVIAISQRIQLPALREYRMNVGQNTRRIVQNLSGSMMQKKVIPSRLEQLRETGSVSPQAVGLLSYWGGLTIAGLLLMPPTRHTFIHLNEAMKIKHKIGRG